MAHLRNPGIPKQPDGRAAVITSKDNRWLKRFRSALAGEHSEDGLVGVEGVRLVEAALGSGLPVEALLASTSGERHLPRLASLIPRVQLLRTTDRLFAAVADTQTPQGVAALVRPETVTVEDFLHDIPLIVVLVGVQDPGNVGTILRAANAFGATGGATCPGGAIGTADPFGPKSLRASAGAALQLPILRADSSRDLLAKLQASGVKVYAAVAATSRPREAATKHLRPWEADWKSAAALLIGNEGSGLPDDVARSADAQVSIPQATSAKAVGIESLNAAMAATVLLYEAMRQRI